MLSVESRQLTFVFADSPRGGEDDRPSDVSVGKSYLLLIADVKEVDNSTTRTDGFRSSNKRCLNYEAAT